MIGVKYQVTINTTIIFIKQGEKDLLIFSPYKESEFFMQETYVHETPMVSKYSGQNEKEFSEVFSEYLKDCESIRNKITSKFYTIRDIETIIREYNKCSTTK